jgi:hypothetical protein
VKLQEDTFEDVRFDVEILDIAENTPTKLQAAIFDDVRLDVEMFDIDV